MGNTRRLLAGGLVMTTTVTLVRPASAQPPFFSSPTGPRRFVSHCFFAREHVFPRSRCRFGQGIPGLAGSERPRTAIMSGRPRSSTAAGAMTLSGPRRRSLTLALGACQQFHLPRRRLLTSRPRSLKRQ
jgi:hypothetical protein